MMIRLNFSIFSFSALFHAMFPCVAFGQSNPKFRSL